MLDNRKRRYMLATFTVEKRPSGWFFRSFKNSYGKEEWHGPYSPETSVSLMIAQWLKRELVKRDRLSDEPPRLAIVI